MVKKTEWDQKIKSYQKTFQKHGVSPKSLKWKDERAMQARFEAIAKELNFEWKTVLDVGCGYGLLYEYLAKQFTDFSYTGVDMVPEFVDTAKAKYTGTDARFECVNFFETDVANDNSKKHDVVICSGVLNSSFDDADAFRKQAIKKLFASAEKALVFNMAGSYPQPDNTKPSSIYYADSLEVLKYCYTLTTRLTYNHSYRKMDFTVAMFK